MDLFFNLSSYARKGHLGLFLFVDWYKNKIYGIMFTILDFILYYFAFEHEKEFCAADQRLASVTSALFRPGENV